MKTSRTLRRFIAIGALSLLTSTPLVARTWTASDDATKTFEGELKSYNSKTQEVTIFHNGGHLLTFPIAKLSQGDQTFIKENNGPAAKPEDQAAPLKEQKIGQNLADNIVQFDGKNLAKAKFAFAPEYYLLYYAASW